MALNSRILMKIEVKALIAQVIRIQPDSLKELDSSDESINLLSDSELQALIEEMKDLLRTLGGVKRR